MRKLLVVTLAGMIFSKIHFGSFVPPEVKICAPGFDLTKDGATTNARRSRPVVADK